MLQVAFVPQEDNLLSTLTVAECITYSALLRLPSTLSPEQIQVGGLRAEEGWLMGPCCLACTCMEKKCG